MCFDNDNCEWVASFQTDEMKATEREQICLECGRIVPKGMVVRTIYQRESEDCECQFCAQQHQQDPDYDGPDECLEQFGEEFSGVICPECCQLLKAIDDLETKEGCPKWARQPLFGELAEVFLEHQQNFAYAEHAVGMFPDLYTHPFILDLLDA